jgi:hypothetical protein
MYRVLTFRARRSSVRSGGPQTRGSAGVVIRACPFERSFSHRALQQTRYLSALKRQTGKPRSRWTATPRLQKRANLRYFTVKIEITGSWSDGNTPFTRMSGTFTLVSARLATLE